MSAESFVTLHHILINDCLCPDWMKWTLLAKGAGCMEQGHTSIWIGILEVMREIPADFYLQGEILLEKGRMENEEAESG
ncbi:uncharacterized protein MONOS_17000 [Monocercomonoides exilis]|uniref:uncharacterized protein n=1 Tax=Monocercomonoides exilis TaxID=2049356 RepID=UPI003559C911|nr:hypothetical protein MONOS_17000 [Monocercomonoides exilis]